MARLELARQCHTPLKRARIPIPPHPRIAYISKKYEVMTSDVYFSRSPHIQKISSDRSFGVSSWRSREETTFPGKFVELPSTGEDMSLHKKYK